MTIERIPNKFPPYLQNDSLTVRLLPKMGDKKVFNLLEKTLNLSGTLIQKLKQPGSKDGEL